MDIRSKLPPATRTAEARRTPASGATPHARPLALALAAAFGVACGSGMAAPTPQVDARARNGAAPSGAPILWLVENCNDAGAGSLRDAAAHALDGDAIDLSNLACSTISVTSGTIKLADVSLTGPGADALTIDGLGNGNRRIFSHVGHGGTLTLRDVTVHGGKYQSDAGRGGACLRSSGGRLHVYDSVFDGCIAFAPSGSGSVVRGGAIAAYGSYVMLSHVTLTNNQARATNGAALGGALYVSDRTLISNCTISNNSATAVNGSAIRHGGGVFAHGNAELWYSTLDGNLSGGNGGGAFVEGNGGLAFSTVSNNTASGGGSGIVFSGTRDVAASIVNVIASTVSGNVTEASTQTGSGALYVNTDFVTILGSTIAGNVESNIQDIAWGAGIMFGPATVDGMTMSSTIVHGNHIRDLTHGADIGGPLGATIAGDHNLIGVAYVYSPPDTIQLADPLLGPLQDNGGRTWTRMPAAGSPAIDHGDSHGQVFDQREYPRVAGAAADIGAVEALSDVIFADGFDT